MYEKLPDDQPAAATHFMLDCAAFFVFHLLPTRRHAYAPTHTNRHTYHDHTLPDTPRHPTTTNTHHTIYAIKLDWTPFFVFDWKL